jgi:hypothetical protein
VLEAMGRRENLRLNGMVQAAVFRQSRESSLLHQLLFAGKMQAAELDELFKELADLFAPCAANEREAQLVHGIHEDTVLMVHGFYADGAGMVPG